MIHIGMHFPAREHPNGRAKCEDVHEKKDVWIEKMGLCAGVNLQLCGGFNGPGR